MTAWADHNQIATATPDSAMPASIAGIAFATWSDAPADVVGWEKLVSGIQFEDPPMESVSGKKPASGAVVVEADERVWVVSPTNKAFGYLNTFPKGKIDTKSHISLRATALKEVFEESGLQIALTGFMCDSVRDTSVTRYYLGRRIGGNPAAMDWESQAVHLVPVAMLAEFASHPNDKEVIAALLAKTKGAQ
jgi:ADP-ribose pyrophosphatase YjhB (NUDIX family)